MRDDLARECTNELDYRALVDTLSLLEGVGGIMSDHLRLLQDVFARRGLPLAGRPGTQS